MIKFPLLFKGGVDPDEVGGQGGSDTYLLHDIMFNNRYLSNKIEYKEFRKILRNRSTSAESTIWNLLKNKKIDGRKFRRQHSIKNYIVDFYCSSEKLIIELDEIHMGNPFKFKRMKFGISFL